MTRKLHRRLSGETIYSEKRKWATKRDHVDYPEDNNIVSRAPQIEPKNYGADGGNYTETVGTLQGLYQYERLCMCADISEEGYEGYRVKTPFG